MIPRRTLSTAIASILVALAVATTAAHAQSSPSPAPSSSPAAASPSPSASPTPRPGSIRWSIDAHTTFVSDATNGPGQRPVEGAGFANGDPLAPQTPYDLISSVPLVPGNASESAVFVRPSYSGKAFDASLTLGAGYVRGSVTNAVYWGESLLPTLNPHVGAQALPYAIVFPAHAGGDDGTAFAASVLGGSIASKDGNVVLKGGWFDLTQTAPFVFMQPAITSSSPAIGVAPLETLGDGPPALDAWQPSPSTYPLHGIDAVFKRGLGTVELADASLPALAGTAARMRTASVAIDHGEGTRYTAQYLQVSTGGDPVSTTVLYGADGRLLTTVQGQLPISTIGGQRQRIFGLAGTFHAARALDAVVELGHSTYDADGVARPGTGHAGNYYHGGITRSIGRLTASFDLYRNEAYYANVLLPYGVPENVWSAAWSWPGQWLKSNYQLINDFPVNIDRQGYRVRVTLKGKETPLDLRASYANFGQIDPISISNATTTGFIDGFFLPQQDGFATLGRQHQYGLFVGYHPKIADVTFDYAEDTMRRPAAISQPQDTVSYDSPEAVLTVARKLSATTLISAGLARYGMRGSFGQGYTNLDYAQRTGFAGLEFAESAHATALLTLRRSAYGGMPAVPGGPSSNFTGTLLVLEQRYHL